MTKQMERKYLKKKIQVKPPTNVPKVAHKLALVKDFNYKDFKKIADQVPFNLQEWSQVLHVSERTLQRYAKANNNFPFSIVDRVLQIDKVIKRGTEVFGDLDKFLSWLKSEPEMLEGKLSFQSLRSIEGINLVLTQLGRIEHGILA